MAHIGKTPYRADSLLSLRGVAALLVVCHHLQLGLTMAAATGIAFLGAFAISGSYAVFVFFCISGYLMAKILDRDYGPGSLAKFYWNRATRILPTYYLAVIFTVTTLPYAISLRDWPILLLVNNYFFSLSFPNAPLWSLATECQFYILAPAVAWATRRWRIAPLLLLAVGLSFKLFYWFGFDLLPEQKDIVYMGLEANLIYFMTGWSAYTYRERLPILSPARGFLLIGAALAAMWLFHFHFIGNTAFDLYRSAAWMLTFPLIMCVVALVILPGLDDGGRTMQQMSRSIAYLLYFLGVTSYSAYVLHIAVYNVMRLPVLFELAAIYAFAYLVFVSFERPLFRLRTALTPPTTGSNRI